MIEIAGMRTRQIRKRIARLERLTDPRLKYNEDGDVSITLEELCRQMWTQDKKGFMKFAENSSYRLFVYRFQAEDVEAASNARRRLKAGR